MSVDDATRQVLEVGDHATPGHWEGRVYEALERLALAVADHCEKRAVYDPQRFAGSCQHSARPLGRHCPGRAVEREALDGGVLPLGVDADVVQEDGPPIGSVSRGPSA